MSNKFTFGTPQDFADLEVFARMHGHIDPQPPVWNNPSEMDAQYTIWGTPKPVPNPNRFTGWKILEGAAALVIGYKAAHFFTHMKG